MGWCWNRSPRPSANAPFMMPKKTAETPTRRVQIKVEDVIGSGPFVFDADEWKPGEKVVFTKNTDLASRAPSRPPAWPAPSSPRSTASNGSGSPTPRPRSNALHGGRDRPRCRRRRTTCCRSSPRDKNIQAVRRQSARQPVPVPLQHACIKPFDDPKIRHAAMVAFGQEDFLKAAIGDPKYYKVCKAALRVRHAARLPTRA